jgi:hypothetical protein
MSLGADRFSCSTSKFLLGEYAMSGRAVSIRSNPGGQQKWSNIYSCAITVVVVIFVVAAVSSLLAQTSTTGAIAGVVTDPTAAVVSGVSVTLNFHKNKLARIIQFFFSATRTLFGVGSCRRISRDRQECNCRPWFQRYSEPAAVDLLVE